MYYCLTSIENNKKLSLTNFGEIEITAVDDYIIIKKSKNHPARFALNFDSLTVIRTQ